MPRTDQQATGQQVGCRPIFWALHHLLGEEVKRQAHTSVSSHLTAPPAPGQQEGEPSGGSGSTARAGRRAGCSWVQGSPQEAPKYCSSSPLPPLCPPHPPSCIRIPALSQPQKLSDNRRSPFLSRTRTAPRPHTTGSAFADVLVLFPGSFLMNAHPKEMQAPFTFSKSGNP